MSGRSSAAIVLGGGLTAALTAALLAKRGLPVSSVDHDEPGRPLSPWLGAAVSTERGSRVMELVHSELGVRVALEAAWVHPRSTQVVFRDRRAALPGRPEALAAELGRAFPERVAALHRAITRLETLSAQLGEVLDGAKALPPSGFFARRAAALAFGRRPALARSLEASGLLEDLGPELELLFSGPLPFAAGLDGGGPCSAAHVVRTISRLLGGVALLPGTTLVERLLEGATEHGLARWPGPAVAIHRSSDGVALELAGGERVEGRILVDATAGLVAADLPGGAKLPTALDGARAATGAVVRFSLELDRDALGPVLGGHTLLFDGAPEEPPFGARPILLVEAAGAPPGRAALEVHVPVSSAEAAALAPLEGALLERLGRLVPFLPDARPTLAPPSTAGTPLFAPIAGPGGALGPALPSVAPELIVAGAPILSGLGVEGCYLAALRAADACAERLAGAARPPRLGKRAR